jgi:phosphoribosylanthranilate isomerase
MTPDPILKICGITRLVDALHAVREGATALGFVFWPDSPRRISPEQAREIIAVLPSEVTPVGVFVNEPPDGVRDVVNTTGIKAVQLHGDEVAHDFDFLECPILRSVTLEEMSERSRRWPAGTTWLLDAADRVRRGGTGVPIDWSRAYAVARHNKVVLAGGLTPSNVEEAIRTVQPFGVDVSSGVESSPGIKDVEKVASFVTNARRAFALL